MNDFVFAEKDGALAFVGDFEGLYRAEADPWDQSARDGEMAHYYRFSRQRIVDALRSHRARGNGLEIGCGHGHAIKYLRRHGPTVLWRGADISLAAIKRARELQPELAFEHADIRARLPWAPQSMDVVLLNQTLWYVLDRLDDAIGNCCSVLKPDGLFVVSQAFLAGEQRYGRHIADGFYGALTTMVRRFPGLRLVEASYDDTGGFIHHDGLLAFRKV